MESTEVSGEVKRKKIDQWDVLRVAWAKKKSIAIFVVVICIITAGITLLVPNKYRSTAVVLPDSEGSKLGGLGGLADLASMAGVSVGGGKSWVELYPQIITSEAVLKIIIHKKFKSAEFKDSVNLIEYFEFDDADPNKNYDKTLRLLTELLEISADKKTRILTVSMTSDESQLAADIINSILKELDDFIRTKRVTSASERRKWIDQRLSDVKRDLTNAENSLRDFRERNRVISNSPQLLLEQQRLIREVEINSSVFIELKKQLELAKIDEINTMPIINILDAARQTTIKESPRRSIIVLSVAIMVFFISVGYFVTEQYYGKPVELIRHHIFSRIKS